MSFLRQLIYFSKKMFILSALIILVSCAYFNMYFNGKEYYQKAEDEYLKKGTLNRVLYENSVKELSKILEFYPESRWVDDALYLIGCCSFRMEQYLQARRKYQELLILYPSSDLKVKAQVGLAQVEIALGNREGAMEQVSKIDISEDEWSYDILLLKADFALHNGDTLQAINYNLRAINDIQDFDMRNKELEEIARLSYQMRQYEKSLDIYKILISSYKKRSQLLSYSMGYLKSLRALKKWDNALYELEQMLENKELEEYKLSIQNEIGLLYLEREDYSRALNIFGNLLSTTDKSQYSKSELSKSAFYIGEIELRQYKNLTNSKVFFDSSRYYDAHSEYGDSSKIFLDILEEYENNRTIIKNTEVYKDSIQNKINIIETELKLDLKDSIRYLYQFRLGKEQIASSQILEEKFKKCLKNAEIFIWDLHIPDSAEFYLEKVLVQDGYPNLKARAMLYYRHLDSTAYSEKFIIDTYPQTETAFNIKNRQGIIKDYRLRYFTDEATSEFTDASKYILSGDYLKAYTLYGEIIDKYPYSNIAAEVLKKRAILAEKYLDNKRAQRNYKRLLTYYPNSKEASFALSKMEKKYDDTEAGSNSGGNGLDLRERWYLMDRRNL